MAFGKILYERAQASPAEGEGTESSGSSSGSDDDAIDAEFEVKDS
jgi:hypothetical protein